MFKRGLCGWVLFTVGASVACGGSVSSIPGEDSGTRPPNDATPHTDATPVDDGGAHPSEASMGSDSPEATTIQPYDGTTGKACTTDADCKSKDGPGIARCSNSVFAPDDVYPTAVCILPTCSPVSDDSTVHYCDGPDDPSSPGMCLQSGTTGAGICYPKCSFDATGDAPRGCQGKDRCRTYNVAPEGGYGYCGAGCTEDSDCQDGQHCQTARGTCLKDVIPPTKTVGEACTMTDYDDYACYCLYGGASDTGYCTRFCIVGGPATCPSGFVCGADESRADGYTTQNTGMGGRCHAECSSADGGGSCPAGTDSTCSDLWAAGPYCIVP